MTQSKGSNCCRLGTDRKDELLADLLHDMGLAVGYKFDRVQIRRGIYAPRGHADWEIENQLTRRLWLEVLTGRRALPMDVRSFPNLAPSGQPDASALPSESTHHTIQPRDGGTGSSVTEAR